MTIRNTIFLMLGLDALLMMAALYFGGHWVINSQLAFVSSLFVTLASFYAYKKVIEKRLELERESIDQRDTLDKVEDPYDLYSEEVADEERDLKAVIQEERAKIVSMKATANNLAKSAKGAFSPYRLLSYLFLFVAFLYLVNNHLFDIWAYLSGLFVIPLSALLSTLVIRK